MALDHKREAILVAVRGTLSLKVSWDLFFPPFPLPKIVCQLSKYGLFVVCLVFFLSFPTDSPLILILKVDTNQLYMSFPVLCLLAGRL